MAMLGGWNFADLKEVNLPQKVATAFTEVMMGFTGASYTPILYVGSQVVNGINYMIICKGTLVTKEPVTKIVKMVINVSSSGETSIVSINDII